MARGRAHDERVKAQVVAALLLGMGVMETARQFNLPESSVRNFKNGIPADKLAELSAKKGERLDDLLYGYLTANLQALTSQAEEVAKSEYIQKQPAGELANLHGVMADKSVRLLEAAWRARNGAGDGDRPALPAPRAIEGQE